MRSLESRIVNLEQQSAIDGDEEEQARGWEELLKSVRGEPCDLNLIPVAVWRVVLKWVDGKSLGLPGAGSRGGVSKQKGR